jgi:hypothetical protein
LPLLSDGKSAERLRPITYRGVATATMVYDNLLINEVLRKVGETRMFGIMDLKSMKPPFSLRWPS